MEKHNKHFYILNIGDQVRGKSDKTFKDIVTAINKELPEFCSAMFPVVVVERPYGVENTYIQGVILDGDFTHLCYAAYKIAEELEQDCIAIYNPYSQAGCLVGPKSDDWGEFNPEHFLVGAK